VGFERLFSIATDLYIEFTEWLKADELRSWVQIPPGPFLTMRELRYYIELLFSSCRTKPLAMPMPYPPLSGLAEL
jgi:hypothetical protein